MTGNDEPRDALMAWINEQAATGEDETGLRARLSAELSAALADREPQARAINTAELAAWVEGRLDPNEAASLLQQSDNLARVEAAADFLERLRADAGAQPDGQLNALRHHLKLGSGLGGANIIPLRRPLPIPAPVVETVYLLAAAGQTDDSGVVCRSDSGVWELRSFSGRSLSDQESGRGDLLLTIHPDHAVAYEGRSVRVYVTILGVDRVLAEDTIRDGALFVPISLTGLKLRSRDAINVVFGPATEDR